MSQVFIGIGGNLSSATYGLPLATLTAAIDALGRSGVLITRRSRWYESLPLPASDQPMFVNGVLEAAVAGTPERFLGLLHAVEAEFGRVRGTPNAARVLDLDLLAFGDVVCDGVNGVYVPHPRLHERAFVLKPMAELAPDWRHPVLGLSIAELLDRMPPGQWAEPVESEAQFRI
jgi:2-amino-4-hydroxy-6-hydroxymethyldihydropteridine diphosphokinase